MALQSNSGTITTSTGTVVLGLTGETAVAAVVFSGTYAGVSLVFEGSNDGTNWFAITAVLSGSLQPALQGAYTLATNATTGFLVKVGSLQRIRVRATAYSSGTLNVLLKEVKGGLPQIPNLYTQNSLNNAAKQTVNQVAGVGATNFNLVSSGPGVLHRYVVTTTGGAATSIVFYDSATTSIAGLQPIYTSAQAETLGTVKEVNVPFKNGLTIATVNTSAAVTVGYTLF